MVINEKLEDYKYNIESALAGFIAGKQVHELDDSDIKKAKDVVMQLSIQNYMSLIDALDREDFDAVSHLVSAHGVDRPEMGESIKSMLESDYLDADLLLNEGFTYFGIFEDEGIRNKVAKYLDENQIEYMDDGTGHLQMKFGSREDAYRAESAISRLLSKNNSHYVRDSVIQENSIKKYVQDGRVFYAVDGRIIDKAPFDVKDFDMEAAVKAAEWFENKYPGYELADDFDLDIEDADLNEKRKPFPDPGKKYRRFGKPKRLTGGGHHLRKLQKKNGGQGCFTEEQHVDEGKTKPKKPMYVRSGGAPAKQSGAGAHAAGNKRGKEAKMDPLTGKHKKDLSNLEEIDMNKKDTIKEGVMGMVNVPALNRMRQLAGLSALTEDDIDSIGNDFDTSDTSLPVTLDVEDDATDIEPDMGMDSDMDNSVEFVSPDDVESDSVDEPMPPSSEVPVADMPPAPDVPVAAMPPAAGGIGNIRADIETAITTMITKAPELKISDYKSVLSQAEDAVAQMRAMGSQYLKEAKSNETLREWATKQVGFKKVLIKEQLKAVDQKKISEKWAKGSKVKSLDKYGKDEKSLTDLRRKQKALRDKSDKSAEETQELRRINFAIRSRTGWGKA